MRVLQMHQFLPTLLLSAPKKICRKSQSSAWIRFFRVKAVVRNLQANEKALRSVRIMSILLTPLAPTVPRLRLCSFVIGSAFVGISKSVKTRQWLFCLKLSLKLSLERVWGTQELSYISLGVALDKIPSTSSGRKFKMGCPSSSPIHLYQVWYWRGPRRVQPHLIFLRKTSAFGRNNTREN